MSGTHASTRRRIDEAAKACFVAAIRSGASRDDAAAEAGFSATAFYNARDRDAVFRQAWAFALELSAHDQRRSEPTEAAAAAPASTVITPNANRQLQRRCFRRRLFDDKRKQLFLDHFAGTADAHAAAEAAGVGYSTVLQHRRIDPEFAAGWGEALGVAYAQLEAEAVRQRLEAQRDFRANLKPAGEMAKEFDRVMQLLARYRRPDGRIGLREVGAGNERRWSFDESILELDRSLRALGLRHGIEAEPIKLPPPPDGT